VHSEQEGNRAVLGFGAIGEFAIGDAGPAPPSFVDLAQNVTLVISNVIIPDRLVDEGILVKSTSTMWAEIVSKLASDWSLAFQFSPRKWEEIVAGAFQKAGYDEVVLTPSRGDRGRDVIAMRRGVGCVKIIGSVKAYGPGNLVPYDAVRSLLGVLSGEQNASKGIITTTSAFPPNIENDPFIRPFLPTRLELMDGQALRRWLVSVGKTT
jgi:restriction system protein